MEEDTALFLLHLKAIVPMIKTGRSVWAQTTVDCHSSDRIMQSARYVKWFLLLNVIVYIITIYHYQGILALTNSRVLLSSTLSG